MEGALSCCAMTAPAAQAEQELAKIEASIAEGEDFRLPINSAPQQTLNTDGITIASYDTPIPETNPGYRMLLKMGWSSGRGLGRELQGRVDPLRGGGADGCMRYGTQWQRSAIRPQQLPPMPLPSLHSCKWSHVPALHVQVWGRQGGAGPVLHQRGERDAPEAGQRGAAGGDRGAVAGTGGASYKAVGR